MKLPLRQSITSPDVIMDAEEKRFAIIYGPGGIKFAAEIVQACNAYPDLLEACKFWLGAVQNSLALRLALTGLPEGAGPALVEMLQDAIAQAESTDV